VSHTRRVTSVLTRWPTIVLLTLVGLAIALAALTQATARYAAHADVLVSPPEEQSTSAAAERTIASYAEVLGGRTTAAGVVAQLSLDRSTRSVDRDLDATVVDGTAVLRVTATSDDADEAARLGQSAAESFVAWLKDQKTTLTASIVSDAVAPTDQASPDRTAWLLAGGLAGLLVGLVVAALRSRADHSIHSPTELEADTHAPVLGAIAFDRRAGREPLITSLTTQHPRFEAFRILRTNLQFLDLDRAPRVITITSAVPGEGKTTTACNLAIALAQAGVRVAVVEGDLRRPRISTYLGVEKAVGLTTVLLGRVSLDAAMQTIDVPGLEILASGSLPPNPSEILQTTAMSTLIAGLHADYDMVVIDAPPLLPVTDAALLASLSDGAILVVRHGSTKREAVRAATERLSGVGATLLGSVLTMTPSKELVRHGYGYGYGPEFFAKNVATGKGEAGRRRAR